MKPKELEFLKHIVITEYQASVTGCFFASDRDKLVALLDEKIARQNAPQITHFDADAERAARVLTNFEVWKAGLTLEQMISIAERLNTCAVCPSCVYEMEDWDGGCEECFRAWADSTEGSTDSTRATDDSTEGDAR